MVKTINRVKEVEVASVAGSNTLTAGAPRRAVERCKEAIAKIGVLQTPVIGTTKGGNRLLLSGQCELMALRELGIKKMDAVEVDVTDDVGARAKLQLMLISLKEEPGALCEGLLLEEAVAAGVPRIEIQNMLGKSASWVSNRISLVTRLDGNVYEMVKDGLLDARSAEEVARLPACVQFAFAEAAVRDGLPKSAIGRLVSGYNDETCPDAVKAEMLKDPRTAMRRMTDIRRGAKADKPNSGKGVPPYVMEECINTVKAQAVRLNRILTYASPITVTGYIDALTELETELLSLLAMIKKRVYPGKKEVGNHAG